MLSAAELQSDASCDIDSEGAQNDSLQIPPLRFPSLPYGRGGVINASGDRVWTHNRIFSNPTYLDGLDTDLLSRPSQSNFEFLPSRFEYEPLNRFLPQDSNAAMEDFLDASLMAAQYLDLPTHCSSIHQDSSDHSYSLSDSSASSPDTTDTASGSSPRADIFSAHSSPGYLLKQLPDTMDTARPRSEFGSHPPSPHYLGPYAQHHVYDRYQEELFLPRVPSFHDSPMRHHSANSWGYMPPSLPYIFQNNRPMIPRLPSPGESSQLLNTFGHYPVPDDLRRWPQMFKINQVKKSSPKKQQMACLFCRERKIGCSRPPEDELDQTCNQCARRKRKCVYPTESRRGQHTRNRFNSKKFLGLHDPKLEDPKDTPSPP